MIRESQLYTFKKPNVKDVESAGIKKVNTETEEDSITVSGNILVDSWSGRRIRIDVFDGDQQALNEPRPSVVKVEYLDKPGSYQLSIPRSEGGLWIGAYIDEDADGKPGPKDPSGWYEGNPVSAKNDAENIDFALNHPEHSKE